MPYHSPLRYPGGKGLLLKFMREIVRGCETPTITYVEPFAGGAAVAIGILQSGDVDAAVIGDADPAIAAFWRAATDSPEELAERVAECDVTIGTWHEQAHILAQGPTGNDLELGFATFFLNRTNYSGVVRARPIGGLEQAGPWTLDCRFNKPSLLKRLRAIQELGDRLAFHESDGTALLKRIGADIDGPVFVYADPPYLIKSTDLYMDTMTYESHQDLAHTLQSSSAHWMVSYDTDERVVRDLYPEAEVLRFGLRHSAGRTHVGNELMAFSHQCVESASTAAHLLHDAHWLQPGDKVA